MACKKMLLLLACVHGMLASSFPLRTAAAATVCALVGALRWQSMMFARSNDKDERAAAIKILGGWYPTVSFKADLMVSHPIYGGSNLVRNYSARNISVSFVLADFDYWHSIDSDLAERPVTNVRVCSMTWPFFSKQRCADVSWIKSRADLSILLKKAGVKPSSTFCPPQSKIEPWKTRETPEEHYSGMLRR